MFRVIKTLLTGRSFDSEVIYSLYLDKKQLYQHTFTLSEAFDHIRLEINSYCEEPINDILDRILQIDLNFFIEEKFVTPEFHLIKSQSQDNRNLYFELRVAKSNKSFRNWTLKQV